jgi:hypothetical protein
VITKIHNSIVENDAGKSKFPLINKYEQYKLFEFDERHNFHVKNKKDLKSFKDLLSPAENLHVIH